MQHRAADGDAIVLADACTNSRADACAHLAFADLCAHTQADDTRAQRRANVCAQLPPNQPVADASTITRADPFAYAHTHSRAHDRRPDLQADPRQL